MIRSLSVSILALTLLAACQGQGQNAADTAQSADGASVSASDSADAALDEEAQNTTQQTSDSATGLQVSAAQQAAIAMIGEAVPEFPVIPAIVVPDIIGVQPAQRQFEAAMDTAFAQFKSLPGVFVSPARCEGDTFLANQGGLTRVGDDGSIYRNSAQGVFRIEQDGSGYAASDTGVVRVDESGEIYINGPAEANGDEAIVRIQPDGAGYYSGRQGVIRLDGAGEGYWSGPQGTIRVESDGSGYWEGEQGVVRIEADGSGYWSGPHGVIRNEGKGFGSWSKHPGKQIPMDPVPRVAPAGRFPPQDGFRLPGTPCGFVITLQDGVLFDFDQFAIRPDAAQVLDALGKVLSEVNLNALEVHGHTDAKGSDSYNQTLSERRAQSVVTALRERGVTTPTQATGYGESRPVAANEINGQDNPAGRQQNRRVEIFVRSG